MPPLLELVLRIGAAVVLCAAIGLERELLHKDAGLRTHTLVGLGAALVMIVSQFGFFDVLAAGTVVLDPSRVAAQVVSGIGFLGGGLIFVRSDVVRGLTTAASVWLAAAVGLACGAGLPLIAAIAVCVGILLVRLFEWAERGLLRSKQHLVEVHLVCEDEPGVLAHVLSALAERHYNLYDVGFNRDPARPGLVTNTVRLSGQVATGDLVGAISAVPGVVQVHLQG